MAIPDTDTDIFVRALFHDVIEEDKRRTQALAIKQMEETRAKMDDILAHPKNHSQTTLTGSFLEAIGIKPRKKGRPSEVEINMQEINEREEIEWAAKRAKRMQAQSSASSSSVSTESIGVKPKKHAKRSGRSGGRGRRRP